MVERVRVELKERSYDILVGDRLLATAGEYALPLLSNKNVIVVSDEHVARFYLHRLTNALDEKQIRYRTIIVKAGEGTKSLASFGDLLEQALEQKPDRNTTLIALGGGVVGDITGFAASVLLRGLSFIQIPTTLLAQVDSSVGGKTGINSQYGKNLIGSFHQPKLVLADVSTLATLPKRDMLAGYAEVLKYALIENADFFEWLDKNATAMLAGDNKLLAHAIVESCKSKAAIVAADERESGKRALLNFGHTFAHALEAEMGYDDTLLHGEAVAIGMILAMQASVKLGHCKQADLGRVLSHYKATGLPSTPTAIAPKWNIDRLMEHFTHDKKAKEGNPTFILSRSIGQAFIAENVDKSMIRAVLAEACGGV